jgi:glycosyltransferase involved in cell wall biosynthesis
MPWMQAVLPVALRRSDVDVCHFTNYYAPAVAARPQVVTFYDMSTFLMPAAHPRRRVAARRLLRLAAKSAAAIITLSESVKRDIVDVLGVTPESIHVVPAAAASNFRRIEDAEVLADVARRYGLSGRFLICLGTIEPRKNLDRAVQALALLGQQDTDTMLVIAGATGWRHSSVPERVAKLVLGDRVKFLGHVPDADLPALLSLAEGLVYPSLYEGFGLPILEAMACGTPVIASDRGATAEVGAGAALLVDVRHTAEIANAMRSILFEPTTADRMRLAGMERAAQFSWARAARETLAVYESVAGKGGRPTEVVGSSPAGTRHE